ncbi:MAG: hypothetical protein A2Y33_08500 [Spirochaetes bacterium GWF1_51_8]|nr:MAG: hypothetical protein A2Y33_08500 [Spirochaetes bacterium GWF1_51_8]
MPFCGILIVFSLVYSQSDIMPPVAGTNIPATNSAETPKIEWDTLLTVPYLLTNIHVYTNHYTNTNLTGQLVTNTYIYTNFFVKEKMSILNTMISNLETVSNLVISNIITLDAFNNPVTNVVTNYTATNVYLSYTFHNTYPQLVSSGLDHSWNELYTSLAELLWPKTLWGVTIGEWKEDTVPLWKKKAVMDNGDELTSDAKLSGFSEDLFDKYILKQKFGGIKFTPDESSHLAIGFEEWDTKILIQAWIQLKLGYGWTTKDENFPQAIPGITPGFSINQTMRVNVIGKFGDRIEVNISQDSLNPDNLYEITYKALKTDTGILRELKAGNISLTIPASSYYISYSGTSKDTYGVKAVLEKYDFTLQTILSLTKSSKGYKKFVGNKSVTSLELVEFAYRKRQYFVLPDPNLDTGSVEVLTMTALTNLADRQVDGLYYIRLIEGTDYFLNYQTGELQLKGTQDRNNNLLIKYTHSGLFFSTNTNTQVGSDDNNGDRFLYLWQSGWNFSPYQHCGYYSLGQKNFDPTRGFSLKVYYSADKSQLADVQFQPSEYEVNTVTGMIKFYNPRPFPDTTGKVYTNAVDPSSIADSTYTMKINFNVEVKNYKLDMNIVTGTVKVFINGTEIAPSSYTVIDVLGELVFNNPALINENDSIEVYYEYRPFFAGAQKFDIAARLDWKPSKIINLGGTVVYGIGQRSPGSAPYVYSTPTGTVIADIDGNIDIGKAFGLNEDFVITCKGEYAVSSKDINTVGYALIDDFESVGNTFRVMENENLWILAPPTTNIPGIDYNNRGALLYKDYRSYYGDGSFSLLNYSATLDAERIKPYSEKPGPYLTLGGHLDPAVYPKILQSSLIFDYDFTAGSWVGASMNFAGPAGIDFSEYNSVVFWVKVQSDDNGDGIFEDTGSHQVEVYVAVGQPQEDTDGDGLFDGEADRAQAGFEFNNFIVKSSVDTYIGRGRLGEGDGMIQNEDLNRNGVLDTLDSVVVFPSATGSTDITNAVVSQGSWQKVTINVKSLTAEQIDILEHSSAVTVYIKSKSGVKGRVIIDTIEFKQVRWNVMKIDGVKTDFAQALLGEPVSVYNTPQYSDNRFYIWNSEDAAARDRERIFDKLHGQPQTYSDANQRNEASLAIHYSLSNVSVNTNTVPLAGGKAGTFIKEPSSSFDITHYKYLKFYIYIPEMDENGTAYKVSSDTYTNESFIFLIGNSETSYFKWAIPLDRMSLDAWHEVTINIFENLRLDIDGQTLTGNEYPSSKGFPNLNDINHIEIGVETTTTNEPFNNGTVWVNEMYVSMDDAMIGTGAYINPRFEYKKPVLKINDTEIIGPVLLNSTYENRTVDFISSEGGKGGSMNDNWNINFSSSFFKEVKYSFSYNRNYQSTDTNSLEIPLYLQWNSASEKFNFSISYNENKKFIPAITHNYTESFDHRVTHSLISYTNDYVLGLADEQFANTLSLIYKQSIPVDSKFTIIPEFSLQDSAYLMDKSNYTNESARIYVTNANIYGMKNLKKTLTSALRVNFWEFSLAGSYIKIEEKYDKIIGLNGFRNELELLKATTFIDRYFERITSIGKGFYFEEENLDKQHSDALTLSFTGSIMKSASEKAIGFSIVDSFARDMTGFTFDANDILTARTDKYILKNLWTINLFPKWLIFDTVNFEFTRGMEMSYSGISSDVPFEDALNQFGQVYYVQPIHYSALFLGAQGRINALELVRNYSDGAYSSTSKLDDKVRLELIIPKLEGFWRVFIPQRYGFYSLLTTSRTLSSFYQSLDNKFDTTFKFFLSEFTKAAPFKLGDMNTTFSYQNIVNYNERKITDKIQINTYEQLWLSQEVDFRFGYIFTYTSDYYIQNREDFESLYGFTSAIPTSSPRTIWEHSIDLTANWVIKDIKDIKIWFITLNLRDSKLVNKDLIRFATQSILYDGSAFVRYNQKIFEITFEHTTEYTFSDLLTGRLIIKSVVNQYAEISPLSGKNVKTTYFDPGFGLNLWIDLQIKI